MLPLLSFQPQNGDKVADPVESDIDETESNKEEPPPPDSDSDDDSVAHMEKKDAEFLCKLPADFVGSKGFSPAYWNGYVKSLKEKKGKCWTFLQKHRLCVLCEGDDPVDLLDEDLEPDKDGFYFYAKQDYLRYGGACTGCFASKVQGKRFGRNRQKAVHYRL